MIRHQDYPAAVDLRSWILPNPAPASAILGLVAAVVLDLAGDGSAVGLILAAFLGAVVALGAFYGFRRFPPSN